MKKYLVFIPVFVILLSGCIDKDIEYSTIAFEKEDHLICEKIKSRMIKEICYDMVAIATKNHSICDEFKEFRSQDSLYYCYLNVAAKKGDLSICDEIQKQYIKDQCYFSVAEGNISICKMIPNQELKNLCYSTNTQTKKTTSTIARQKSFTTSDLNL